MSQQLDAASRHFRIQERRGSTLVIRIESSQRGLFELSMLDEFEDVVRRADADAEIRAVVLTGGHPTRFVSHADVRWLQEGGAESPRLSRKWAGAGARMASFAARLRWAYPLLQKTPLWGAVQLDRVHGMLTRMQLSGVVFVAALNGSALGMGAEIAWACDVRIMANDGPYFIGHPEVLLGFAPGGGGTQRLARLVGPSKAIRFLLEGRPMDPQEALALGAVDELAPQAEVVERAIAAAEHLGRRSKWAVEAIKRAVHLGGSMPLEAGLCLERAELLAALPQPHAQELMRAYVRQTDANDELPFYVPAQLEAAIARGHVDPDA